MLNWTASFNAITYDIYRDGVLYSRCITGNEEFNIDLAAGTTYSYYVQAINSGCATNNSNGELSANIPDCSGITNIDPNNPFEIKVFPNPSSGVYFLTATNIFNKEITIQISNVLGQQLYYIETKALTNDFNHTLNIQTSQTGIYFIKITIDQKSYVKQILKQ